MGGAPRARAPSRPEEWGEGGATGQRRALVASRMCSGVEAPAVSHHLSVSGAVVRLRARHGKARWKLGSRGANGRGRSSEHGGSREPSPETVPSVETVWRQ